MGSAVFYVIFLEIILLKCVIITIIIIVFKISIKICHVMNKLRLKL